MCELNIILKGFFETLAFVSSVCFFLVFLVPGIETREKRLVFLF